MESMARRRGIPLAAVVLLATLCIGGTQGADLLANLAAMANNAAASANGMTAGDVPSPTEAAAIQAAQAAQNGASAAGNDEASWVADKPSIQGAIDHMKSEMGKVSERVGELANRNYVTPGDIVSMQNELSNASAGQLKNAKTLQEMKTSIAPMPMLTELAEQTSKDLKSFKTTQAEVLGKISGVLTTMHNTQELHDKDIHQAVEDAKFASDEVKRAQNNIKKVLERVEHLESWKDSLELEFEKKIEDMRKELEKKLMKTISENSVRIDGLAKDLEVVQVKETQDRKAIQVAQTSQASDHDRIRAMEDEGKDNRANVHQLRQLIASLHDSLDSVINHDKNEDIAIAELKVKIQQIMTMLSAQSGKSNQELAQKLAEPQGLESLNALKRSVAEMKPKIDALERRPIAANGAAGAAGASGTSGNNGSPSAVRETVNQCLNDIGLSKPDVTRIKDSITALTNYALRQTGDKTIDAAVRDASIGVGPQSASSIANSASDATKSMQSTLDRLRSEFSSYKTSSDKKVKVLEETLRQLTAQNNNNNQQSAYFSGPQGGGGGNSGPYSSSQRSSAGYQGGQQANMPGFQQGGSQQQSGGQYNTGGQQGGQQSGQTGYNGQHYTNMPNGGGYNTQQRSGSIIVGSNPPPPGSQLRGPGGSGSPNTQYPNGNSANNNQQSTGGKTGESNASNSNLGKTQPCTLHDIPSRKPGVNRKANSGATAEFDLDIQDYNGEVESFKVTVKEQIGAAWTEVESREVDMSQDGTSLLTSGLKPNTKYKMQVCACNCKGCGGCSEQSFSTDSNGAAK